eukprot:GILK01009899.1.p1 GENE.GILK01009899.1~~GILK01009899.1.p1  ORF type:complete len:1370 (+),score=290.08 GILK01009899.1:59-4111(+)
MAHIADYFAIVGVPDDIDVMSLEPDPVIDDTTLLSPEVRKDMQKQRKRKRITPVIRSRYPAADKEDFPLQDMVTTFCFPLGVKILHDQLSIPMPKCHYFVLTGLSGERRYATCLTFYEERDYIVPLVTTTDSEDVVLPSIPAQQDGDATAQQTETEDETNTSVVCLSSPTRTAWIPKCILILSRWPFFAFFKGFLSELYRISLAPSTIPIERWVVNLIDETPLPPPGKYELIYSITKETFRVSRPPSNQLPLLGCSVLPLFQCLSLPNIITVLFSILLERKVVLMSRHLSLLTVCSEILQSFLFPFFVTGVFVPLLPSSLSDFLHSPVPFLIGVHSDLSEIVSYIPGLVVVDLDRNYVDSGTDSRTNINILDTSVDMEEPLPPLPEHHVQKLMKRLKTVLSKIAPDKTEIVRERDRSNSFALNSTTSGSSINSPGEVGLGMIRRKSSDQLDKGMTWDPDLAFASSLRPEEIDVVSSPSAKPSKDDLSEYDVRTAFMYFFVSVLRKYKQYLIFPSEGEMFEPDPSLTRWFNRESFLQDGVGDAERPFMAGLIQTQLFAKFVQDRVHPPSPAVQYEIQFFDEQIDAKQNRSKLTLNKRATPFLNDKTQTVSKTFVVPSPDTKDLDESNLFTYRFFPDLDGSLMYQPRAALMRNLSDEDGASMQLLSSRSTSSLLSNVRLSMGKGKKTRGRSGTAANISVNATGTGKDAPVNTPTDCIYGSWVNMWVATLKFTKDEERLGRIEQLLMVLDHMLLEGLKIPTATYRLLIEGLSKHGTTEMAVRLFEWMTREGVRPEPAILAMMIHNFAGSSAHKDEFNEDGSKVKRDSLKDNRMAQARRTLQAAGYSPDKSRVIGLGESTRGLKHRPAMRILRADSFGRVVRGQHRLSGDDRWSTIRTVTLHVKQSCPACGFVLTSRFMKELGWVADPNDYTCTCPVASCRHRFIPQIQIKTSVNGPEDIIVFLSPWTLLKEVENMVFKGSPNLEVDPSRFGTEHANVFWNLLWHFADKRLPFDFLLPYEEASDLGPDPDSDLIEPELTASILLESRIDSPSRSNSGNQVGVTETMSTLDFDSASLGVHETILEGDDESRRGSLVDLSLQQVHNSVSPISVLCESSQEVNQNEPAQLPAFNGSLSPIDLSEVNLSDTSTDELTVSQSDTHTDAETVPNCHEDAIETSETEIPSEPVATETVEEHVNATVLVPADDPKALTCPPVSVAVLPLKTVTSSFVDFDEECGGLGDEMARITPLPDSPRASVAELNLLLSGHSFECSLSPASTRADTPGSLELEVNRLKMLLEEERRKLLLLEKHLSFKLSESTQVSSQVISQASMWWGFIVGITMAAIAHLLASQLSPS